VLSVARHTMCLVPTRKEATRARGNTCCLLLLLRRGGTRYSWLLGKRCVSCQLGRRQHATRNTQHATRTRRQHAHLDFQRHLGFQRVGEPVPAKQHLWIPQQLNPQGIAAEMEGKME
jgi:hypothetical protein